jgi:general secretion pathway protein F
MGIYRYEGVNVQGRKVDGVIEADSLKNSKLKLKQKGIYATNVREKTAADNLDKKEVLRVTIGKKIKDSDITMMTRQLATMINANIPIVDALTALSDQVENERLKLILTEAKQKVNEGSSIADALGPHKEIFSPLYINMIKAGEASGTLGLVMERLAEYTEKQSALKNKIVSTMAYPVLMVIVSVIIIGVLFMFVIPKITAIFDDMAVALPIYTRILISISNFARNNILLILITVFLAVFGFTRYIKTSSGRRKWDDIKLKLPLFGRIVRLTSVSQFTRTLATLHGAGVPLLQALDIVVNVVDNTIIKEALKGAKESLSEGQSLASTLSKTKEFPPIVIHMISVGEKTGELEVMLSHISKSYENEVETRIETLTSLLEPAMIILMGGAVAFIVMAILMPIMQIASSTV